MHIDLGFIKKLKCENLKFICMIYLYKHKKHSKLGTRAVTEAKSDATNEQLRIRRCVQTQRLASKRAVLFARARAFRIPTPTAVVFINILLLHVA